MANTDINTYEGAVNYLKTSPMFNLSLSSKELFHSNFLYWIYTRDRGVFERLIQKSFDLDISDWGHTWDVKREKENFDLSVCKYEKQFYKNGTPKKDKEEILLVIENKFKSLPTDKQLEDYDLKLQKHENCKKRLLSLTKPSLNDNSKWKWVGYDRVIEELYSIQNDRSINLSDYDRCLVGDYVTFVQSMITLIKTWIDHDEEENAPFLLDYKVKEQGETREENTDKVLEAKGNQYYLDAKELRIHDLYGKYRTTILKNKLCQKINNKKFDTQLEIIPQMAYSNSQPILEVMIKGVGESTVENQKKEAEAFFISIQGCQYRHAINARDKGNSIKEQRVEESVTKCRETENWHWFMNPKEKDNECFNADFFAGKLLSSAQRSKYCSFAGKRGVNYIYQYKKISPKTTVEEVLDIMVKDVENIIQNFNNQKL